jgi:hypothetical protein
MAPTFPEEAPKNTPDPAEPTLADATVDGDLRQPTASKPNLGSDVARFPATERFVDPHLIGTGGMGLVYRTLDLETGQHVALKTLRRLDPEEIYRLKQEFRTLAGILHPNLVQLYELFAQEDACFVTMELLDGVDFVRWVRAEETADLVDRSEMLDEPMRPLSPAGQTRLRHALEQLMHGLAAVHAANRLHRDIKPSNALVTRDGRVVILDFGLAARLVDGRTIRGSIAGTPVYMAPEQARGEPLTPACDWYSVGVMVYECLTGRRPVEGDSLRQLQSAHAKVVEPRTLGPAMASDLSDLAMRLLDRNALTRATIEQVAQVVSAVPPRHGSLAIDVPEPFVGRTAELAQLWAAWHRVAPGQPQIVHVSGPSGMGKSELLQHFLHDLEDTTGALTLAGRCHPQETVSYKALDAIIDALQHFLETQPSGRVAEWLPQDIAALLRVFPALRGVGALVERQGHVDRGLEPHEVRRRAFAALRTLLANVARAMPLVLAIDDLHWGDLDSVLLLRELFRPPQPPGVLLLLAWRREEEAGNPILRALLDEVEIPRAWLTTVRVEPLDHGQLVAQARSILKQQRADLDLDALADEASGSPFFLGQLVRYHAGAQKRPESAVVRLSDVLTARLGMLETPALRLLEVIAVAGRPLRQRSALQAAGLGEAGRPLVLRLQQAGLLRASASQDATTLEAYHHRIRETLLGNLLPDALVAHHRTLADVLSALQDADPEELVEHFVGSQQPERAANAACEAADKSLDTLAFDHAARLYRQALTLGVPDAARTQVLTRLAEALAFAGRGTESAQAYLKAADCAQGEAGAGQAVLTLRRRAGEEFLHSGRFQEGQQTMTDVLAALGLKMPASAGAAMRQMLWGRLRLMFRGIGFTPRRADEVDPRALAELDALWGASTGMAMVNHLLADALGVMHLWRALSLGERSRVSRSLGYEAAFEATLGLGFLRPRLDRMLHRMAELADATGNPYDAGWYNLASATCNWFRCNWQEVVDHADLARATFRQNCRGVDWEQQVLQSYALSALACRGGMRELQERLDDSLRDAEGRGDLFALANCVLGQPTLGWLASDRAVFVRERADALVALLPSNTFLTQHYHHLLAMTHADLYLGDPLPARARLLATWPRLKDAHFLALTYIREELLHLRGRSALALAVLDPGQRAALLTEVKGLAKQLQRSNSPVAKPFRALLLAGVCAQEGDKARALTWLTAAHGGLAHLHMDLYLAASRRVAGQLSGDAAQVADADAWMAREAVLNPAAMAATLVPGFV